MFFDSTRPDAILHLAAPLYYNTSGFERDLMIPAIKSSTAILDATKQLGSIQRVVHTSSFAAYYSSKTVAERAAWIWMEDTPFLSFDLARRRHSSYARLYLGQRERCRSRTLRALEGREAGGERYLLAAGVYCNQEIADVAWKVARKHASSIPRGSPGLREADNHFGIDATKTKKALGIKWQGFEEVLAELLRQLFQIQE
ncbi:hypothetical protein EDB80DRAFT_689153 [Ilyonectria destructans]|nr:hypothetical protein EDB80DRAFT_689153 [Ilyonectria destructans]